LERSLVRHLEGYIRAKFNVTIGRAACEACSATWNLGTKSAFALGPRKTKENPGIVGSRFCHTDREENTTLLLLLYGSLPTNSR
jgi:hypothetical protein